MGLGFRDFYRGVNSVKEDPDEGDLTQIFKFIGFRGLGFRV